MAYLARYFSDAENIIDEILIRHSQKEYEIYNDYKAARVIQRWFRGYITRKHLKFLNDQATVIQKHWRTFLARKLFFLLLQARVKKFYEDNYNRCAILIQKTWRGYLSREYVFSYLQLKRWKNGLIKKNKFLLQLVMNYKDTTWSIITSKLEKEAEEWLFHILFKSHHLLRTYQRKGIYSLKSNKKEYSVTEELIQLIRYTQYMMEKQKKNKQKKVPEKPEYCYKFQGLLQKCEKAWLDRYTPNLHSVFSSGIYGEEEAIKAFQEFLEQDALIIHDKPMHYGVVRYDDRYFYDSYDPTAEHKHTKQIRPSIQRKISQPKEYKLSCNIPGHHHLEKEPIKKTIRINETAIIIINE